MTDEPDLASTQLSPGDRGQCYTLGTDLCSSEGEGVPELKDARCRTVKEGFGASRSEPVLTR
jgi:hypothetical protein